MADIGKYFAQAPIFPSTLDAMNNSVNDSVQFDPILNAVGSQPAIPLPGPPIMSSGPRTFYRGDHPGRTQRISTGDAAWDNNLFASSDIDGARMYGPSITQIDAKPDARILYEGSKEFRSLVGNQKKGENLLDFSSRAAQAARDAGYDATWFKRQSDVGTAIHNPAAFTMKPFVPILNAAGAPPVAGLAGAPIFPPTAPLRMYHATREPFDKLVGDEAGVSVAHIDPESLTVVPK